MSSRRLLADPRAWLCLFALILVASLIRPRYPEDQLLQQFGTTAGIVIWVVAWRRWDVPRLSLALFLTFLTLHVIGARWVYSFVPYDDWSEALLGWRIGVRLGFTRNHYDRF